MTIERYLARKETLSSFEMVLAMVLWYRKAKRRIRAIKRAGRDDDPVARELGELWEARQKRLREKREKAEAEKGAASGWSAEQLNLPAKGSAGKFIEGSEDSDLKFVTPENATGSRQDMLLRTLSNRLAMDSRREEANQKRLVDEINRYRDRLSGDDRELADAWIRRARNAQYGQSEWNTKQLKVLLKDIQGLIDSKNR